MCVCVCVFVTHRSTHWKQTVFYLEDVITICQGESLTGWLSSKPNVNNPRDLDITLHYTFQGKRLHRHTHVGRRWRWGSI